MHPFLHPAGAFRLTSYSAMAELGAVLAFLLLWRHRRAMGLRGPDDYWLLLDAVLLGGFLGGRLVYLATGGLRLPFHWQEAVFPLTNGFSVFGVAAGMGVALLAYARLRRHAFLRILDPVAAVLPFWMATARVGCLLAGCCHGRPAGAGWPWTVTFTDPACAAPRALLGVPLHPAQLYEAAGDLVLGLVLARVLGRTEAGRARPGTCTAGFLVGYGVLRFALEFIRGDADPWLGPLSLGQGLALACVALGGAIALGRPARRPVF
jgi:phosphatidylglycerol---prolipoprotein diacylglyceryl transferase